MIVEHPGKRPAIAWKADTGRTRLARLANHAAPTLGAPGAAKPILCRISPAFGKRHRRWPSAHEEEAEDIDGIAEIDRAVVVGVGRGAATRLRSSGKEPVQGKNPIGYVDGAVIVGIAANEVSSSGAERREEGQAEQDSEDRCKFHDSSQLQDSGPPDRILNTAAGRSSRSRGGLNQLVSVISNCLE